MSGFEIAGIVLGSFPILIEAAKPFARYLEGAERWWHFKTSFRTLTATLEDELIAYSQNLELLLTPVDLDSGLKAKLQEDPKSDLWHDPEVQAKLKSRIKNQYMSWFQRQLLDMRETLNEIQGMLPINQDGKVWLLICQDSGLCLPNARGYETDLAFNRSTFQGPPQLTTSC